MSDNDLGRSEKEMNVLYLVLALAWLCVAVIAFLTPQINPEGNPWIIPGTDISIGWVGVFFFVYNLLRWWSTRTRQADRRFLTPTPPRPLSPEPPPDPNFNFTDRPPPAGGGE